VIDLGTLGAQSWATGVNDRGEVVGFSDTWDGLRHGFVWRQGVMTDLGPAGTSSVAYDVNSHGVIAGGRYVDAMNAVPVTWTRGRLRTLTELQGVATAINDRGDVAGQLTNGSFFWSGGRLVVIPQVPGLMYLQAEGLNDRGQVVGMTDSDAFLWQDGTTTFLPRLAGSTTTASDINDRGWVVGFSATTPDGLGQHAVLWIPRGGME
jgi:probable HAF family extracellular repeat protein